MLTYETALITFLLSISPLGEARSGIPYGIFNDMHPVGAFALGLAGNLLVYPLLMWSISAFNQRFWKYRLYKKGVIRLSHMARRGAGAQLSRFGFWGLMMFVMIPLPGTGAYMGTIAAAIFKIERKRAFAAISLGIIISSLIMLAGAYLGNRIVFGN